MIAMCNTASSTFDTVLLWSDVLPHLLARNANFIQFMRDIARWQTQRQMADGRLAFWNPPAKLRYLKVTSMDLVGLVSAKAIFS